MIKCAYCGNPVTVINDRLASHGSRDKNCKGSGAQVRGNWRDDPTFSEAELLADAQRDAEAWPLAGKH